MEPQRCMIPADTGVFYVNLTLNRMSGAQSQTTRPRTRERSLLELERHEEISLPYPGEERPLRSHGVTGPQ